MLPQALTTASVSMRHRMQIIRQQQWYSVKWMTEESGFAYNEGGIPIAADDNDYPDAYAEFGDVTFVSDESALEGEEDFTQCIER